MTARLSASVPPEVKITWLGADAEGLGDLALGLLEPGPGGAAEPVGVDGFPQAVLRNGSIASRTSGRTGVVAAWSR